MIILAIIVGAATGAFGRRVAGGLFEGLKGTRWQVPGLVTHLVWAIALGLAVADSILATHNDLVHLWWFPVAVGVGTFVGHSLGLHNSLSMGRYPSVPNGPNDRFSWRLFALHWLGMTAYGVAVLGVGVAARYFIGSWNWNLGGSALVAAAVSTPAVYALMYRLGWLRGNPAEWILGATYGAACGMVML